MSVWLDYGESPSCAAEYAGVDRRTNLLIQISRLGDDEEGTEAWLRRRTLRTVNPSPNSIAVPGSGIVAIEVNEKTELGILTRTSISMRSMFCRSAPPSTPRAWNEARESRRRPGVARRLPPRVENCVSVV